MGNSKIEYCDKTWNVTSGCTKASNGCTNCWAERVFPRVYGKDIFAFKEKKHKVSWKDSRSGRGKAEPIYRKFTDIKLHYDKLEQPLHWKKPQKIFVNSMSDLFHEDVPFEFIADVFDTMCLYPLVCRKKECAHEDPDCFMGESLQNHIYQILTKRPERMGEFFEKAGNHADSLEGMRGYLDIGKFPPDNIWPGVSIEDQKTADERIHVLLQIQAKVHWLSIEPMLEYMNISVDVGKGSMAQTGIDFIDWVVVGAESGSKMRYCAIENIESIVEQCKSAEVPPFVKQVHLPIPLIKQKSVGKKFYLEKDINKFPKNLQIREYPK